MAVSRRAVGLPTVKTNENPPKAHGQASGRRNANGDTRAPSSPRRVPRSNSRR